EARESLREARRPRVQRAEVAAELALEPALVDPRRELDRALEALPRRLGLAEHLLGEPEVAERDALEPRVADVAGDLQRALQPRARRRRLAAEEIQKAEVAHHVAFPGAVRMLAGDRDRSDVAALGFVETALLEVHAGDVAED